MKWTRKASLKRRCLIRDLREVTDGAICISDRKMILAEGTAKANPEAEMDLE